MTSVKTRAAELLRSVHESRRQVVITQNGEPRGVFMDFDSYRYLREALLMLKVVALGEGDAAAGRLLPQSEVFPSLRHQLREA